MTRPQWDSDGFPANDAAAIADAIVWLEFLHRNFDRCVPARFAENGERLARCIAEMRKRVEVVTEEEAETS